MYYEREEDILSDEQIEELARQGLYPAMEREPSPTHSESSSEYPGLELSPEDLANIDRVGNSEVGARNATPTPAPAPAPDPPPPPITVPLSYAEELRVATKNATKSFYPHPWQIAVAWALHHGSCDALVVAGTGYGKTLPFVLNLFLNSAMIVWIVSPLNYIEMEQVKVFTNWGLRAVAVNSMTMRPGLLKEIEAGKFQVVISSIESMMASNKLRPILGSRKLAKRQQLLVLDEAHCVSSWAEAGFRPLYAMVGNLRRLLPVGTPVLAATATANKEVRASIQKVLAFRPNPYIAILGNFRANLIHIVHCLKGAAGAVKEILHYFPSKTDLPVCLIFVNSRAMGQLVHRTLWDYIDPSVRGQIHFYHAFRGDFAKEVLAEGFRIGVFRVLICTESLTMGADFRNVTLVINFLCPSTLLTWLQRAGRGARDEKIVCRTVLMVQPLLFEKSGEAGSTSAEELAVGEEEEIGVQEAEEVANGAELDETGAVVDQEDEEELFGDINHLPAPLNSKSNQKEQRMTYTKSILGYIQTTGCRNAFLDKEYNNPKKHTTCTTCDNCLGLSPVSADPDPTTPEALDEKPNFAPNTKIVWLRPAERESCEDRLREWRRAKWASAECADMDITVSYILSDKVLTSIAKHPCIESVADFTSSTLIWPFYKLWGDEIIDILRDERQKRWCKSAEKKLLSKIRSKQNNAKKKWMAEEAQREQETTNSSRSPKKRKKSGQEEDKTGTSIKMEPVEKRIKQEMIDQTVLNTLEDTEMVEPRGKGSLKGKAGTTGDSSP